MKASRRGVVMTDRADTTKPNVLKAVLKVMPQPESSSAKTAKPIEVPMATSKALAYRPQTCTKES